MNKSLIKISAILVSILFLLTLVFADTNGIWHYAKDVQPGTFGDDEIGFTSEYYYFINPVSFTNNVLYKGTELDARYVRLNETSITSNMIVDGTITSADVAFNYAGSSSKGGSALNSNACNGDGVCEIQNGVTSEVFTINKNAQGLTLVGSDHTYIGFYPDGVSSGRKAWLGFGDINQNHLTISSNDDILLSATNYYLGSITENNKIPTKSYVDSSVVASVKDGVSWTEVIGTPAGFSDGVDNGLLSEVDGSTTNEIQTLSISGNTITISGTGGNSISIPADGDSDSTNEKPLAGTGISVSDRTVSVDTTTIATKTYVDTKSSAGWVSIHKGSSALQAGNHVYYNDNLDHSPTKVCTDAGYTYYTGACRFKDSLDRRYEGSVVVNTLSYSSNWGLSCAYGMDSFYFSITYQSEILCIK